MIALYHSLLKHHRQFHMMPNDIGKKTMLLIKIEEIVHYYHLNKSMINKYDD